MAVNLTAGAISAISSGESQDLRPVFQVMDIKLIKTANSTASGVDRYKVMLSDGLSQQQGMLATQRNHLVTSHQLQKGSVVQLNEFVCNRIRDRVIIIIVNLEVIVTVCDIIGDPEPFKPTGNETPSIPTPTAPLQPCVNRPATMQPSLNQLAPMQSSLDQSAQIQSSLNQTAPMQSSMNQPASTVTDAHISAAGSVNSSVTRPNSSMHPAVRNQIPPQNPGLQSYGNSFNNFQARQNNSSNATFTNHQQPPTNNRMNTVRPAYNQHPQMHGNRGPMGKTEAPARTIPIAALNMYQGNWTIKARITVKGDLRTYRNTKGEGQVFSFDLLDSYGGEIRATCFNDVAKEIHSQIEAGKVFYISKGTIKPAQKAFNHLKNDLEITLDSKSTIQPCLDDDTSIPRQQFHFLSVDKIENMDNNTVLDIIGVVSSIEPPSSIQRKNNTGETFKQALKLIDMSEKSISLTLWGKFCEVEGKKLQEMRDSGLFPVLAVKSARVYEFNGKSIGTISSSQLLIDPDYPEASKLKEWFNSVGMNINIPSVSMSSDSGLLMTISQIKDDKIGASEKADVITVHATIWYIKRDSLWYTACPNRNGNGKCAKKVVKNDDGKWQCDRCNVTFDECDYRYLLQLQIQDHTGMMYATAFQETGEVIMGISAKDLYILKEEKQDDESFSEFIRNALFNKYSFKLKVKQESYNDQQLKKSTVMNAEKLKLSSHTKTLLSDLGKLDKLEDPSSMSPRFGLNPRLGQQTVLPPNQVGHNGSPVSGFGGRNNCQLPSQGGSNRSSYGNGSNQYAGGH